MLKYFYLILLLATIILNTNASASAAKTSDDLITKAEQQEAREIAERFFRQFLKTKDLAPMMKEFYWNDFVERYQKQQNKNLKDNPKPDVFFAPGLSIQRKLLTEGNEEDLKDFYIATHNLLFSGALASFRKMIEAKDEFEPESVFPSALKKLFDKNPNLKNMLVRREEPKPIATIEEMRLATTALNQGAKILNEAGNTSFSETEIGKLMQLSKEFPEPKLQTLDEEYFGFQKDTRVITAFSPIMFNLMLAKDGDKLKIFWTVIYTE